MSDAARIPVIIGVGEVVEREGGSEPRTLIATAARVAAGARDDLLARLDSIDVVSIVSWRYADIASVIANDIGARPGRRAVSADGGEKPVRLLCEAAQRIAEGDSQLALICGGEATRTRAQAARSGTQLGWGPTDAAAKPITALDFVTPHAARYGLIQPTHVYPLYENATRHSWGQSSEEADHESARLWHAYSRAAQDNPYAWLPRAHGVDEIATVTPTNRLIAYPYRKLMVANPAVNQSAAILVASLALAREIGIPDKDLVYVWGGARANEPADFLRRDRYDRSTAQNAVLDAALSVSGRSADRIDLLEFYSCFPTVPKMARRNLGLPADISPSVAGGLTFFGGPANNYMSHAIAAAVRALRGGVDQQVLLYGQGEFVTKHAAVILGRMAPPLTPRMTDVQEAADKQAGPVPELLEDYQGPATVETFTIVYDREGLAEHAPVVLRTPAGARLVARVDAEDIVTIERLGSAEADPIGASGEVRRGSDDRLHFSF